MNSLNKESELLQRIKELEKENQTLQEQSEERKRIIELFETTQDIILFADQEGTFVDVNPAFTKILGYERDEIVGVSFKEIIYPPDLESSAQEIKDFTTELRPVVQFDNRYTAKDKSIKWLSWNCIYDPKRKLIHSIARDITEKKKRENRLSLLEDRLLKRTLELEQSNKKLEKFASVASHDLKAPLRMIVSFLKLLKRNAEDKLNKKELEYLDFAYKGALDADTLINGILQYSQISISKEKWAEVNLNTIMDKLMLIHSTLIKEKNALIEYKNMPTVRGNKTQLYQLFQNFLNNALKFSNEKPIITIKSKAVENGYEFEITDNGIGIDEKDKSTIFNLFGRAKNQKKFEGQGIGLTLCKEIIENHSGKVWVESELGKGSSFYFTLET